MDDQGTIFTVPRPKECDTERTLNTLRDDASEDYATSRNSSNLDPKDASPFAKSLSQLVHPTASSVGSDRDASKQVQKYHFVSYTIGDPEERIRMRGKLKVNYREMVGYTCYTSSIEPKNFKEALEDKYWLTTM